MQQSVLEHSANVDIQYLVTTMPEECSIWLTDNRVYKKKRGRMLGEKAQKSLVTATETQKDGKRYTHTRNVNKNRVYG